MKIGILGVSGQSVFLSCDHFHKDGETVVAQSLWIEPGGKGFNQAVAAKRLGAQVVFLSCVGEDDYGKTCQDFLHKENITCYFQKSKTRSTAYASILTDAVGNNRVSVYRGAADEFNATFVRHHRDALSGCDFLLLNLECPMETFYAAVEIAREFDIPVVCNPAPAQPLPIDLLTSFYLITPNHQEASILFDMHNAASPADFVAAFQKHHFAQGIVTLGRKGSLLWQNGKALLFPALPVNATDTTGAGDSFNAALVVALGEGKTLTQSMKFATNVAAFSVTRPYVMPSLPFRCQVQQDYPFATPKPL